MRIIPDKYWDENKRRFDSHLFFDTVNHHHISDYSKEEHCDLMIVECSDGRWYIEDNWGRDAQGAKDVFNPFDKQSYPTFFPTMKEAAVRAAEVVSSITGSSVEFVLGKLLVD